MTMMNTNIYNLGKNEGKSERNIEIIKKMLEEKLSLDTISKLTSLSLNVL